VTPPAPLPRPAWRGHAGAVALCLAAAALALPLATVLDSASLVLLFMLAVVLSAARYGRGPALVAAALSVLLFNIGFVPPRFSLSVADERFLFTLAVMGAVGLVVGQLTAGLKAQALAAQQRERQMLSLYGVSRDLGRALTAEQVAELMGSFVQQQLGTRPDFWLSGRDGTLQPLRGEAGVPAKAQPPEPTASPHTRVLPLPGTMAVRGVMALQRPAGRPTSAFSDDELRLLDTCATLMGSTLERLHYIEVARDSAVEIEGERLRSSLLAGISHDLRTPLASLVGLSESLHLTRPPPTPQQADIASAMAATARRMAALVHNLLDMARLQAGAVRLDLQWQPLEEVLGAAIAAAEPALAAERVRVALPADLPLVRLDAVLMERVFVNLLENVAKHTPAGSTVQITAGVHGEWLQLRVADDGPGLPPGRHEQLFQTFERGERESATPGVGLGLALCRAIVLAHQGRIQATDAPGGGALFVIELPLGQAPALPAAEPAPLP
jgi:two-component system, OmpR family, sensor histidine kinase KdpD